MPVKWKGWGLGNLRIARVNSTKPQRTHDPCSNMRRGLLNRRRRVSGFEIQAPGLLISRRSAHALFSACPPGKPIKPGSVTVVVGQDSNHDLARLGTVYTLPQVVHATMPLLSSPRRWCSGSLDCKFERKEAGISALRSLQLLFQATVIAPPQIKNNGVGRVQ